MLTLAKAKNGPLVSYLQKEYKDAENGTITDSKNSASSSYTPFIAPQKSSAEFRQQNLENLHVFLQNKALHAVSTPFRRRFVQKLAYSHLALAPCRVSFTPGTAAKIQPNDRHNRRRAYPPHSATSRSRRSHHPRRLCRVSQQLPQKCTDRSRSVQAGQGQP